MSPILLMRKTESQGDRSFHKCLLTQLLGLRLGVPWLHRVPGICDVYTLPWGEGRVTEDKQARFQIPMMHP